MSNARSWRSASHAAGSHDWFPKKLGARERQDNVDTICTVPLDCGTSTTRRLYPFGACIHHHLGHWFTTKHGSGHSLTTYPGR